MSEEALLSYHISETGKKFDEVRDELRTIGEKIDALQEFRVSIVVNARWVSLVVSAICGFVTLVITTALSFFVQKYGG